MFPFSAMFKKNQMGFNPFEIQKQMMKHPMANGGQSFPFNMMKQNSMMGGQSNSFPFNMMQQQQNPMASGINSFPFNYDNQAFQEENPFLNSFFQPQRPQQGQYLQNSGQTQQPSPPQFPHSLIKDQNGKLDFNKIGNGVQSTLGLVGQMGPMLKMFSGFFR
jgi:hypothetical protein